MQQIVAATDFSSRSDRAVRRAGVLAKQFGAEVKLVHVVDDDQPQTLVELEMREASRLLQEQVNRLTQLRDNRCRAEVVRGDAFDGILRAAEKVSADLIVMGTHRKQLLRDIFVGTTLERVIRMGPFPVLLVNKEADHPYSKVIAAVDFCEPSERALKIAKSVGLIDFVELTLLHAFVAPAKSQLYIGDAPDEQMAEHVAAERRRLRDALKVFSESHKHHGSVWNYRIEEGDARTVICGAVKELRAELLVIGTHGRSGIAKLLLGSVAEAVLRSVDVDILVVPSRI